MFDWDAAEEALYTISKEQVGRFLGQVDRDDVYGFGFFGEPIEGVMLVANTRSFHGTSFGGYVEGGGTTDEETFKWDIGNWEYPGGLFPSSSPEQPEFDAAWEPFREPLSKMDDDRIQEMLETLCVRVLRRLYEEGAFSAARGIEGFIVLGPDDPPEDVLAKKERLDAVLDRQG